MHAGVGVWRGPNSDSVAIDIAALSTSLPVFDHELEVLKIELDSLCVVGVT